MLGGLIVGLVAAGLQMALLWVSIRRRRAGRPRTSLARTVVSSFNRVALLAAIFIFAAWSDHIHVGVTLVVYAVAHLTGMLLLGIVLSRERV